MHSKKNSGWYSAFKAKDARFDGRMFVGVSSTGIYCRPICSAPLAKEENCTFYASAAAAELAGFRPCFICRPELAPGSAPIDATSALAHKTARLLEEHCGSEGNISDYARRLGCSDRHLRRAFKTEFSVTPIQYLQTCRMLLAKKLLTDTDLAVTDVAIAAGVSSLRRFNELFKQRYGLSPTAFRKRTCTTKEHNGNLTLLLCYRPPYQWRQILDFLARRAIPGVEAVTENSYLRTVSYPRPGQKNLSGWIAVAHRPEKNALTVTVNPELLPVLTHLLVRVRHLFDLYCCPDAVSETLSVLNDIRPGLFLPGTRLPGCFEPFEMVVRAILGQQITVKAAGTLAGRLAQTYGTVVETGRNMLTHAFPAAGDIAALSGEIADHLGPLGITRTRAKTISLLARRLVDGEIDCTACAQPEAEIDRLMSIPGIGAWTAQYIAMRALSWPDAFPATDLGIRKALAPLSVADIFRKAESWRPWRGYATISLWNSFNA
ncbi:MAG: AlkA N-terminal domain-containing protein [Desulfopila sp.]